MNFRFLFLIGFVAWSAAALADGEKLATLTSGPETYTNVLVTSVTTTDIYFSHSRGIGNVKLKTLAPDLQRLFHYDAARGAEMEKQQSEAHARYSQAVRDAKAPAPKGATDEPPAEPQTEPLKRPGSSRSYLGQPAPTIMVQKWLTDQPDMSGKFVLVDFWATWCGPCRKSIPDLNALSAAFKNKLLVVGLTDEDEETVRKMTEPKIEYSIAIDTEHRSLSAVGITAIPHALLIDPKGVVRFEGHPGVLDEQTLQTIFAKYTD